MRWKAWNDWCTDALDGKVSRSVVAHQDRSIRFGFDWLADLLKSRGMDLVGSLTGPCLPKKDSYKILGPIFMGFPRRWMGYGSITLRLWRILMLKAGRTEIHPTLEQRQPVDQTFGGHRYHLYVATHPEHGPTQDYLFCPRMLLTGGSSGRMPTPIRGLKMSLRKLRKQRSSMRKRRIEDSSKGLQNGLSSRRNISNPPVFNYPGDEGCSRTAISST